MISCISHILEFHTHLSLNKRKAVKEYGGRVGVGGAGP